MKTKIGYGRKELPLEIDDAQCQGILLPGSRQDAEIRYALAHPLGSPPLSEIVKAGEKIVIVTSDITRPVPSAVLLPPILEALHAAGVKDDDITVVFALGSHRKHTEAEKRRLVGNELYERIACMDFEESQCVHVGVTAQGTSVELFEPVVRADRRICVGNIEYHYFAGYSGGAKALLPGVCSHATIQANHALMAKEGATTGRLEGNPVRMDIDEVTRLVPIDFIVNVVLDDHKEILRTFAGDPFIAHRAGCSYLDALYKVPIEAPADIVVASPGGYPKDINFYQAQKALDNASKAVRDGGVIILAASCGEGFGNPVFERWMTTMTPDEMIHAIHRQFILGGHKAAAIAQVLRRAQVFMVCDMERDSLEKAPFEAFDSLESALREARRRMGEQASVLVLPLAGSVLPVLADCD